MLQSLLESDVDSEPIKQFDKWWQQAIESNIDEVKGNLTNLNQKIFFKYQDFKDFLFKSAVMAMACDGDIAETEIDELKNNKYNY